MPVPFAVIGLTLFFVLAIFFDASTQTAVTMLIIFIAALSVSISVKALRKNKVLPVTFATGAVAFVLLILFNTFIYAPQMSLDGNVYNIKAQLTDYPEQRYGKFYYPANVVLANGKEIKLKTRIVLSSPADAEPYDFIEGNFKFYRLGKSSDEILASYKSSGTYLGAYSTDDCYTLENIDEAQKPFMSRLVAFRALIRRSVYRVLPNEFGSLAVALLLGDKSGLSNEILTSFKNAGVTHIICVSGLHLSIWGFLILNTLRKIGLGQRLSAGLTMPFVVFMMLITGMNYSVVRAGIMLLIFLLSDIFMKRGDSINSLGFALTVMSVSDPFSMGAVGLQLSALSSLGIILCNRYLLFDVKKCLERIKIGFLKEPLIEATSILLITCAAVAFTLPVSAEMSNGFSFLVFPSNLLIIWTASYAMVFSALGAVVGAFSASIFNLPSFFGGALCKYIIKTVEFVNRFKPLNVRLSSEKLYMSMLAVIAFAFVAFIISRGKKRYKAISICLCGAVFVFSVYTSAYFEASELRATAIDVGNGTSVLVTHKGKNILIGCDGTDELLENKITNAVDDYAGEIDAFIVCDEKNKLSENLISLYTPERVIYDEEASFSASEELVASVAKSNNGYAVLLQARDSSLLVVTSPSVDMKQLEPKFNNADVIISRADMPENYDKSSLEFAVINAESIRGKAIENHLLSVGINCVSTGEKGNITVRSKNGNYIYERS